MPIFFTNIFVVVWVIHGRNCWVFMVMGFGLVFALYPRDSNSINSIIPTLSYMYCI